MEQPPMFEQNKNKVCRLRRFIYGLKQSGRAWQHKLSGKLKEIGFSLGVQLCFRRFFPKFEALL